MLELKRKVLREMEKAELNGLLTDRTREFLNIENLPDISVFKISKIDSIGEFRPYVLDADYKKRLLLLNLEIQLEEKKTNCTILMGKDERYFATGVGDSVTSVKDALDWLKPPVLKDYDGPISRQGEWYFVPVTPEEKEFLSELYGNEIQNPGYLNSHYAEELVEVVEVEHLNMFDEVKDIIRFRNYKEFKRSPYYNMYFGISQSPFWDDYDSLRVKFKTYVRGRIIQIDHTPRYFKDWQRVYYNNAVPLPKWLVNATNRVNLRGHEFGLTREDLLNVEEFVFYGYKNYVKSFVEFLATSHGSYRLMDLMKVRMALYLD